jgi:low temperature requirement protein LtrA
MLIKIGQKYWKTSTKPNVDLCDGELGLVMFDRLTPIQRSLVSSVFGLVGYGAWAYMVNSMHGAQAAIKAACVQGGYSFALTFLMTMLIELFYRYAGKLSDSELMVKTVTVFATCLIIFSASWWINVLAGTPEIFNTVILGYVIGGFYTASYVLGLSRSKIRGTMD